MRRQEVINLRWKKLKNIIVFIIEEDNRANILS